MGVLMLNGIPYSGFPEPPAIYSETEREIGVWIDGKPVYEKTALISNIQVSSNNYAQITLSDYFSNVSKVIKYECMTDTGDPIPKIYIDSSDAPYSTSVIIELYSDAIIFSRGSGGSTTFNAYVTLRYTKTTDVPGSGKYTPNGLAHHYSTTEQVIGTWINGKTLYEKTIYYTSSAGQTDSDKIIDNTILHGVNCNVVDVQGTQSYGYMSDQMPNNTSDPEPLSQSSLYLPYYGGGNIASAHIYFYNDGIHFIKRCAASEANSIILTVKYVKKSS